MFCYLILVTIRGDPFYANHYTYVLNASNIMYCIITVYTYAETLWEGTDSRASVNYVLLFILNKN